MGNLFVGYGLRFMAVVFYLFYTFRYHKELKNSVYFSGSVKQFHLIAFG